MKPNFILTSLSLLLVTQTLWALDLSQYFKKSECTEKSKYLPEQPAEQLLQKAGELRALKKDCESASVLQELKRQYPIRPYYRLAWMELINSYLLAEDYIAAINEANGFLDEMKFIPEAEEVHFKLLHAVYLKMQQAGDERSQEWTEYALGISSLQNEQNPFLKNLTFKSFYDAFPNSKLKSQVEGFHKVARNQHADYNLKVGIYIAFRGQHVAAIMRFARVLKWGPVVESYQHALYLTIENNLQIKNKIIDGTYDDQKIAEILLVEKVTPEMKKQVLKDIDQQVKELRQIMLKVKSK